MDNRWKEQNKESTTQVLQKGDRGENIQPTTEILYGSDKVVDRFVQTMQKAHHRIDVFVDNTRPLLAIEFKQIRDAFIYAKRKGIAIRYITEITKANLCYCKELMSIVDELRHLDNVKGNFYVTDHEYVAPSTFHEEGKCSEWIIYSNFKEIVEHQQYVFESLWNTSSSAERKTKEIRNDVSLGLTEIIDNPSRTQALFIDLIKSAKSEILLMLPTANSFIREYRLGVLQILEELSTHPEGRAINIRILTPINNTIKKLLEEMKAKTTTSFRGSDNYYTSNLKICHLESEPNLNVTTATIVVVDRKASLAIEKVNDSSERFTEAVGLSSYSTSQPTVISYISIFENFWNQLELYQKLKQHDKMQHEFINIAAHELRTPAQSILGYAELAKTDPQHLDEQTQSFMDAIYRNALRIQKLTRDILDVTRIESNMLSLSKIKFGLKEVILNAIEDTTLSVSPESNQVKIKFKNMTNAGEVVSHSDDIFVLGDKNRITQVISNLLENAVKFTSKGVVSVDVARKKRQEDHQEEAIVTVEDTGSGINPEIFPRLFTKFSTKSFSGTGLGLYISKNIIEAHGGKIWAENNNHQGKCGATFSFSLPLN